MTSSNPKTKKNFSLIEKCLLVFIACLLVALLVLGGLYIRSCTSVSSTETPTGGGTLKLSGTDPTTLDPALSSDSNSASYIIQIFSGLVRLDEDLEPAPDIAERWEISDDGCTYTFYLRDNVVFQDGRKVTAADFKYSWERACNPETGSITAGTYLGDIVGAKEMLSGQASEISGVQVVNDSTLQVTIDAPKSYFLSKLTYPTAMVVDMNNVAIGDNWYEQPNGTGPFKLRQWLRSSLLVLERNNSYYGEVASLEFVEFHMYAGDEMSLYETGVIDVANVYTIYIDRITDPAGPFLNEYHVSPQLSFSWLGFNTSEPPFDDLNVRKAFSMAIDKDKIINLSLRNLVTRADGVLPPGMPGFNENLNGLSYNVDEAKQLIASSKYGSVENLPPIVLTLSGYGGDISPVLEAVITQWRENLGVEVTVRQLEPDFYMYHLKDEVDNMYFMGWLADYPHPQDFLDVLFHTGNEYNYGGYSNSAFDTLVEQAGLETDYTKSLEMYQQAEQMLVDDAAIIPLWFGQNLLLVRNYVEGYEPNALGYVMLNKVKVNEH
jgi:oligopeptide transport system substrate-binding protein